jgi:DNA-binding NtrC family response regulator
MPETKPVVLMLDDNQASFEALRGQVEKFEDGRLAREFEFVYLLGYRDLQAWYGKNESRFVSLIIQDVDYSQLKDKRQIVSLPDNIAPREWQSSLPDFDEVGLQGIVIYSLMRNQRIDTIAPVLFVSSHIGMRRSREFAEYIVHPGFGPCNFVPEDASGDSYYPTIIKTIDELALRPLTPEQRRAWREELGMVVGRSRQMAHLCYEIERIAPSDAIVLLLGDPGTGKELVARAIHRKSPRYDPDIQGRQRPWTVNIAALEKTLVEDELFGHLRGAYTDAGTSRMGIFEAATGSTVFLDEIGDLSKEVQLKLLRVMEYREIKKLGSSQEMSVDNRIIAATNRTPDELFRRFRTDFLGRLLQHSLVAPDLRRRWEGDSPNVVEDDLREMIDYFLDGMNRKLPAEVRLSMTDVAVKFLVQSVQEYVAGSNQIFANNVRTIKNAVERSFERAQAQRRKEITLGEVIPTLGVIKLIHREEKPVSITLEQLVGSLQLEAIEKRAIEEALRKAGSLVDAAKLLGIHRDTLRKKMGEYGLTDQSVGVEGRGQSTEF